MIDLKLPGCFLFLFIASVSFGQKDCVSLELSISHTQELPYIHDCSSLDNVHVIIRNNTDSIQYFYEDWNSFGYYNIFFEIKTKDSIYEIVRPSKLWYRNFKSHFILNPRESLVFPYLLVDTNCTSELRKNRIFKDGWIGFPPVYDTVEIRAVYQLCRLKDSIPYDDISRLNYGRDFYIDFLDGDLEVEVGAPNQKTPTPKSVVTSRELIFREPLYSSWLQVILN